ncbi:hypothetical protein C8Q76DRAFT_61116 [Earliella scabrosa]|nr:hypothetical protein C8Q76DRAFT_61116 [Earliella scabrosa]
MCSASLPSAHLGPGLRLPPPESGPSHLPPAVKCPACSPFLRLPLRLSAPPRPASRTRADVHFMLRRGRQHTAAQTGNTLRLAALPLPHVYVHSGPQATLFLLWVPDGPSLQSSPIQSVRPVGLPHVSDRHSVGPCLPARCDKPTPLSPFPLPRSVSESLRLWPPFRCSQRHSPHTQHLPVTGLRTRTRTSPSSSHQRIALRLIAPAPCLRQRVPSGGGHGHGPSAQQHSAITLDVLSRSDPGAPSTFSSSTPVRCPSVRRGSIRLSALHAPPGVWAAIFSSSARGSRSVVPPPLPSSVPESPTTTQARARPLLLAVARPRELPASSLIASLGLWIEWVPPGLSVSVFPAPLARTRTPPEAFHPPRSDGIPAFCAVSIRALSSFPARKKPPRVLGHIPARTSGVSHHASPLDALPP